MRFQKITIVGVGLLGGSLGLAIRRRRLAKQVCGYVRRAASIKDCERVGAVDFTTNDLLAAVWNADLVILCTPLAQMRSLVIQMLPALKRGAIVTDVGSVKGSVVKEVESIVGQAGAHFVGGHPMAGGEKSGVLASRADLFDAAICVLTPTKRTNRAALRKVEAFWKRLGARLLRTSPEAHDEFVSRSSHLTYLVATTLANTVLDPKLPKEQALLCATGFRDTTRVASSSPEMWRDIALANRKNLSRALDRFITNARKFQRALAKSDASAIVKYNAAAKDRRDRWVARFVSASQESPTKMEN